MRTIGIFLFFIFCFSLPLFTEDRIPRPEFKGEYQIPSPSSPQYQDRVMGIGDVLVLFGALLLASLFALKWRSRKGLFFLGLFSLLYFGFFRRGCVCSVGALQNVVLAISNPAYSIPITVLAFFLLPLIFALFTGRTFCASVCPIGLIQDLFALRPKKLPTVIYEILHLLPPFYLGITLLYVLTGSGFLICRFDPFIGFFRLTASFEMMVFGGLLLIMSIWVGRFYCRFLCPYGFLLRWFSKLAWKSLTITPDKCVHCHLCADVCPFDAIKKPQSIKASEIRVSDKKQISLAVILFVPIILSGLGIGYIISPFLAQGNYIVRLNNLIQDEEKRGVSGKSAETQSFRQTGVTVESLNEDAELIKEKFAFGSLIFGGFMGLFLAVRFLKLSQYKEQKDYEPERAKCFSCGRCFQACPREQLRLSKKSNDQKGQNYE